MDAYISEAQVVSCDGVEELHTEVIPPVNEYYYVYRMSSALRTSVRLVPRGKASYIIR